MTKKRFTINDCRVLSDEQVLKILNQLVDENEQLKKLLKCSRKEANDYCEELMEKDEFIRLYKRQRDELREENKQLKEVLGSILIEVRRDITVTNHCSEVKAFVTPNSFDLIVDVLKKYGALKGWYE